MKSTRTIWHTPAEQMPDDGITILCFDPEMPGDPVWPGYHDERGWLWATGATMDRVPLMWAQIPHPNDEEIL